MKIKTLLLAIILFCTVTNSYSQSSIKFSQIYLTRKNRAIKLKTIKPSNVVDLFGKPIKIKKEKSGMTDHQLSFYIYNNGAIVFDGKHLTNIDIKKSGWTFVFKKEGEFIKSFTIGSSATELKKAFPASWADKHDNLVHVFIGKTDSSIAFEVKGNVIRSISLVSDES